MTEVYVPYCKNKMASEDLLSSHRTYLCVCRHCIAMYIHVHTLLAVHVLYSNVCTCTYSTGSTCTV